jgi:hypothetical protein
MAESGCAIAILIRFGNLYSLNWEGTQRHLPVWGLLSRIALNRILRQC